jgi:Flp pilus assembly protein TadG
MMPQSPEPTMSPLRLRIERLRRLSGFRRNEDGSAAIEFAVIAPIFFFLMFVIAETALLFIAEQVMDNAVFETARLIRTGQAQIGDMTPEEFEDEVCDRMAVFVDCSGGAFYLGVDSYDTFDEMVTAQPVDPDDGTTFEAAATFDFGEPNDIVVVRAYYQWPMSPVMGFQWRNSLPNGKRLIGSFAAFRNEPYAEN